MAKQAPNPTEGELQILQSIWQMGSGTVREVQAHMGGRAGYTTVLKLMQIMTEKGILARTARGKLHVYRPAESQAKIQKNLAVDLIDRAFGGSAQKLVVAALGSKRASAADLAEIRRLLAETKGSAK